MWYKAREHVHHEDGIMISPMNTGIAAFERQNLEIGFHSDIRVGSMIGNKKVTSYADFYGCWRIDWRIQSIQASTPSPIEVHGFQTIP
jgi:hypothetical protein